MEHHGKVQCQTSANADPQIPDSNPKEVDQLWRSVRSTMADDEPDNVAAATSTSMPAGTHLSESKAERSNKAFKTANSSRSSASTDDLDFATTVLKPRGVSISKSFDITDAKPFEHFKTQEAPDNQKSAYYKSLPGLAEVDIWIDGGKKFEETVCKEYRTADAWQLNERRFSNLAITYLLRQEVMDLDRPKTGDILCERMDEESIKPNEEEGWFGIPILEEDVNTKEFHFRLHPDAVYWISLQAYELEWTATALNRTFVYGDRALCPYLSVEYKKTPRGAAATVKGVNQVATSSAICQMNRYKLRLKAMKSRTNISWTPEDTALVGHYGITIFGHKYGIWYAAANVSNTGEWLGTEIKRLARGDLKSENSVKKFANWYNEIQRWGLSVYGQAVKADIEFLAMVDGDAE